MGKLNWRMWNSLRSDAGAQRLDAIAPAALPKNLRPQAGRNAKGQIRGSDSN